MFGDLSEMMSKLKEAQQKIEETKARLKTILNPSLVLIIDKYKKIKNDLILL